MSEKKGFHVNATLNSKNVCHVN